MIAHSLFIHSLIVFALKTIEGSCDSVHMHKLARALIAHINVEIDEWSDKNLLFYFRWIRHHGRL